MVYEFQSEDGDTVEKIFYPSRGDEIPATVIENGKEYRRIFNCSVHIPIIHRASEDGVVANERALARQMFHEPDKNNPGGASNAEMVKKGKMTTKACKRWV